MEKDKNYGLQSKLTSIQQLIDNKQISSETAFKSTNFSFKNIELNKKD